jgi:FRG domain-containing protein
MRTDDMTVSTPPTLDAVHAQLRDLASRTLPDGRPAVLFRAERDYHLTTFSSLDRFYHDQKLAGSAHDELDDVTAFCMTTPLREKGLPPKLAGAFAQHYGLPTQVFDFTASPEVAVNFAANRPRHRKPWPKIGQIGILDVATTEASKLAEPFDLRKFPEAIRPQRQHAFGLIYSGFVLDDRVDLKRREIAEPIGLEWRLFAHLPDDETYLYVTGNDMNLEDTDGDRAADIPQQMIDLFIRTRRKLSRPAAEVLSKLVPPVGRSPEENLALWSGGTGP